MIQQFYRSTALKFRVTEHIGPFLAAYHPESSSPWLNYATPDNDAEPTDSDVRLLIEAYRQHDRAPRLEYLQSCSPAVRAVLERNGFEAEADLPLMICSNTDLQPVPDPDGVLFEVATEKSDVIAALEVQCEAFGDPPPDETTIQRQHRMANEELTLLLARKAAKGEPAGAGMTVPPLDGVTEVAGIAVLEHFRKTGIAGALTYRLSKLAFERGVTTLFLSPASDEGERIYGRVGYRSVSGILHLSLPFERSR